MPSAEYQREWRRNRAAKNANCNPYACGGERACACCGEQRPVIEFGRDNHRTDGLKRWCKDCRNVGQKRRLEARSDFKVTVLHKKCCSCGATKSAAEFSSVRHMADGLHSWCKECTRMASRLSRYPGLTAEKFHKMWIDQDGRCANDACPSVFSGMGSRFVHVDHCHTSGVIRGLLCHNCNIALGLVQEDVDILDGLRAYLEREI